MLRAVHPDPTTVPTSAALSIATLKTEDDLDALESLRFEKATVEQAQEELVGVKANE